MQEAANSREATPDDYWNVVEYEPPEVYEIWWEDMERCVVWLEPTSGIDYDDITWYVVFTERMNGVVMAYYFPDPPRIFVAYPEVYNGDVISHEMVHALIDPRKGHPTPPYGYCAPETGSSPPPVWNLREWDG